METKYTLMRSPIATNYEDFTQTEIKLIHDKLVGARIEAKTAEERNALSRILNKIERATKK